MKEGRTKEEKKGKKHTNSTIQHEADPCPPISRVVISMPGREVFWNGLDTCPKLTVALCLPVLGRNFPFLIDYKADNM